MRLPTRFYVVSTLRTGGAIPPIFPSPRSVRGRASFSPYLLISSSKGRSPRDDGPPVGMYSFWAGRYSWSFSVEVMYSAACWLHVTQRTETRVHNTQRHKCLSKIPQSIFAHFHCTVCHKRYWSVRTPFRSRREEDPSTAGRAQLCKMSVRNYQNVTA